MKIKQISVQRPEAGDIWENEDEIIYVYYTDEESISFIGKNKRNDYLDLYENMYTKGDERFHEFTEIYKYVGRAKADVKDLFVKEIKI